MQHDTVIWKVISPQNGGFCSFRRRISNLPLRFCKNAYNILGICNEMACPLANSRYATVRERKGECYLMIKTIERSHQPSKHWEKIKLSKDYMTALKQIDEHLLWWPKWYIHKCKLRLTKMHQFIIRSRKLATSIQPKLVRIWKPYERQQRNRERKAEIAAKISNVVKSELLERLHEGVYEGIYNFPLRTFEDVMEEKGQKSEEEEDEQEEEEKEKEYEHEEDKKNEFIGVIESDDDIENIEREYEYEYEYENEMIGPQTNTVKDRNYNNNNNNNNNNNKRNKSMLGKKRMLGKNRKVHWKDTNKKRQKVSIGYH